MRETLGKILKLHPGQPDRTAQTKAEEMQNKKQNEKEEEELCQIREMTSWERVQVSRKKDRPVGSDYIRELFDDFVELHGDRLFGDDKAVVGGIAHRSFIVASKFLYNQCDFLDYIIS